LFPIGGLVVDRVEHDYQIRKAHVDASHYQLLRESRRPELAHDFLNYLLPAGVAAAIVREMRTATANEAARRLLPANDRENPTPYPTETVLAQGEWFE
jgi:spermidine/putrescine transport system substrate-binding protein